MPSGPRPSGSPQEMNVKDKSSKKAIDFIDDNNKTRMMPLFIGLKDERIMKNNYVIY
jgi:hypothetical protein